MTFAHNVEEFYVIKIITNNIVNACSIAIAFRWSAVVETALVRVMDPPSDGPRSSIWTEFAVAVSATFLLTLFAAIALRIGGAMHHARQHVVAQIEDFRSGSTTPPKKKRESASRRDGVRIHVRRDWPSSESTSKA